MKTLFYKLLAAQLIVLGMAMMMTSCGWWLDDDDDDLSTDVVFSATDFSDKFDLSFNNTVWEPIHAKGVLHYLDDNDFHWEGDLDDNWGLSVNAPSVSGQPVKLYFGSYKFFYEDGKYVYTMKWKASSQGFAPLGYFFDGKNLYFERAHIADMSSSSFDTATQTGSGKYRLTEFKKVDDNTIIVDGVTMKRVN